MEGVLPGTSSALATHAPSTAAASRPARPHPSLAHARTPTAVRHMRPPSIAPSEGLEADRRPRPRVLSEPDVLRQVRPGSALPEVQHDARIRRGAGRIRPSRLAHDVPLPEVEFLGARDPED